MLTSTCFARRARARQARPVPTSDQADYGRDDEMAPAIAGGAKKRFRPLLRGRADPANVRATITDQRRRRDDDRKRHREEENADEGGAASDGSNAVLSARWPMRISASMTITSTAALIPNSAPSTSVIPRPARREGSGQHHERARQHEQDAGGEAAATPCISQPR